MKFTTHYDERKMEWVLRIESDNGSYAGIGALNGKLEAEAVRDVLQGALELHAAVESQKKRADTSTAYERGMSNANNIVEGRLLLALI